MEYDGRKPEPAYATCEDHEAEIDHLREENAILRRDRASDTEEIKKLRAENERLKLDNFCLQQPIVKRTATAEAKVADLERQLAERDRRIAEFEACKPEEP